MRPSSWTHRVDLYAASVLDGSTVAGPLVRQACERHFNDRARSEAEAGWFRFEASSADYVIDFIETCLRLPDVVDEDGEPKPFKLSPWQAFIVGSLFGWVDVQGRRRFREGYIEAGKGCGKTPLLAAIGLFGLVMDGERAAEIYAAAADQDQAMIMFRDAVRIAKASPDLADVLNFAGGEHIWQISHTPSLSFFKTFSREGGQKSGPRPYYGLIDELHEHPSPEASIKIRAGAKRRVQPLFLEITNSGFDRTSICWQRHEHARKVMERVLDDEQFFAYVCALDEGDKPLEDESCWPKTNPNIGVSITVEYLRRQVANAKNIHAETNNVLRLNFCVWTLAHTKAIQIEQWMKCGPLPAESELVSAEYCCGCLDLGETDDFTAWGRLWVLDDGRIAVKMRFWVPEVALERYPNRPYAQWRSRGLLNVTEGDVTDYAVVRAAILDDCRREGLKSVFYDPRTARETSQLLAAEGIDVVQIPQGFALNEAIQKFLALVAAGSLCHGNDPILTWMASNFVLLTGTKGDRRMAKERAPEKIDGIAALIMGIEGGIVRRARPPEKSFEMIFLG